MLHTKSRQLQVVICAIVVYGLLGCNGPRPQPTAQSIPIYPNATQLNMRTIPTNELNVLNSQVTETSFQTTDSPATVLTFYKDALLKEGWQISDHLPAPTTLALAYVDSCPWYTLNITLTTTSAGQTQASVVFFIRGCM